MKIFRLKSNSNLTEILKNILKNYNNKDLIKKSKEIEKPTVDNEMITTFKAFGSIKALQKYFSQMGDNILRIFDLNQRKVTENIFNTLKQNKNH